MSVYKNGSIQVLDSSSILVRLAAFSEAAGLLQLDGCQIDGKYVRISASDRWDGILDVIKGKLRNEILSPQVEVGWCPVCRSVVIVICS